MDSQDPPAQRQAPSRPTARDPAAAATPATCPSRIRCQTATGSWTKSRQWETQRTLFSSARAPMWPPTKVDGVWPFNDAWLRPSLSEARRPRRHATLSQSWMQRKNGEFETHRLRHARGQPALMVALAASGSRRRNAICADDRNLGRARESPHPLAVRRARGRRTSWQSSINNLLIGLGTITRPTEPCASAGSWWCGQVEREGSGPKRQLMKLRRSCGVRGGVAKSSGKAQGPSGNS